MIARIQNIDFVGKWKTWFTFSGIFLAVGLVTIALGNLNFGLDFQGGSQFTATNAQNQISEGELREALPPDIRQDAQIQSLGQNGFDVRTPVVSEGEASDIRDAMSGALEAEISATSISPSFGEQIRNDALGAVAASLLVIILFITLRYEFIFALAAMAALTHDIVVTVGIYAIVGREVSLVTVVAVLTILGYSVYDTIIVFDRIRENTPEVGYNRRRFNEMVNQSIRQVVRRSIYTTISTLIPVTALLIFGVSTLADFAFALLVGIAAGAYSSIFIASPVLALLKTWQSKRAKAAEERERTSETAS
ncbi:MAG: protein translocase subunit SecF [Actinomycetota bacterium]|jgi:preprotein translocase SecF subunit|nr:protein translocase subunit SecF [Rubrobacter sp.]MDQ3507867.1 protein translocase subunit SecF [Actinomycetota bacterium]